MSRRDYAMLILLIPEDEREQVSFSAGSMHVEVVTRIHGDQLECAAMLQNMAADVMTSIKNEISKGSNENAA